MQATGVRLPVDADLRPPDARGRRRASALAGVRRASAARRPSGASDGRRTSRSRSSGWAAATRAGSRARGVLEARRRRHRRDLARSRPTAAGTSSASTTPTPASPGTFYSREGGFLDDAADFDAGLLRHRPARGARDGPAAAAVLETAWEALEQRRASTRARCAAARPACSPARASLRLPRARRPASSRPSACTGTTPSCVSGRLVLHLRPRRPGDDRRHGVLVVAGRAAPGLPGPARRRVLAGAGRRRSVMVTPYLFVDFARQRGLAPDGRCKSFGAGADGIGVRRRRRHGRARAALRRAAQRAPRCWPWSAARRSTRTARRTG